MNMFSRLRFKRCPVEVLEGMAEEHGIPENRKADVPENLHLKAVAEAGRRRTGRPGDGWGRRLAVLGRRLR